MSESGLFNLSSCNVKQKLAIHKNMTVKRRTKMHHAYRYTFMALKPQWFLFPWPCVPSFPRLARALLLLAANSASSPSHLSTKLAHPSSFPKHQGGITYIMEA
jgi:hypothetical protein